MSVEPLTIENMHRTAAMIRFDIEAALGHSIPDGSVLATIIGGQPKIKIVEKYCAMLDMGDGDQAQNVG